MEYCRQTTSGVKKGTDLINQIKSSPFRLDYRIFVVIWVWKMLKSMRGTSDRQLDETLLRKLREAGYKV